MANAAKNMIEKFSENLTRKTLSKFAAPEKLPPWAVAPLAPPSNRH